MHSTIISRLSSTFVAVGRRAGVTILGVLACGAAIAGCSSSSQVTPTSRPSATATATATATVSGSAPETTAEPTVTVTNEFPTSPVPTTSKQPEPSGGPQSGKTFPGEGLTAEQARDLQQAVEGGHQPWRLDRIQVAKSFVQQRFGWTTVQASADGPSSVVVTNQDGSKVTLQVSQPVTQGGQGIWVVGGGTWN
ncbi:acyl transferase [Nocardia niigatensis]